VSDFSELQRELHDWTSATFPGETVREKLDHLQEEVSELFATSDDPLEIADCIMLITDIASVHGIDVFDAVREKLKINKARSWAKTEKGFRHQ